jgi:DNA polymerase III sliding clamp (beta) subunit (PCNA family)
MNYQDLYKILTACYAIAPKTDVRYYLNGVKFKSDGYGYCIEATDGHRLVQFKSESLIQGAEVDTILDIKHVKLFIDKIKAMGYHKTDINEVFITGISDMVIKGLTFNKIDFDLGSIDTIDGRYPDCERVIWKEEPTGTKEIGLDARFLADIVKVTKPFISTKFQGIKMEFKDSSSSTRITFDTGIDGLKSVIIIMPCRL